MSLNIAIPALEAKPLIAAQTNPQKIAEFIDKLPVSKPLEASSSLLEEIEVLNRQKVSPDTRMKTLEIYRPTVTEVAELLAIHYCNTTLPLPEDAKNNAVAAESLWRELAYGYKLVLIDQESKLFSLGGKNLTALAIQRALEALSQLAMVYYQTYFTTLSSVWSDMHRLYLHAVKESLETVLINNEQEPITTINLTYKQALLMSLVDPQHLAPENIKLAANYIARYGRLALLHDLASFKNPAGIFLVSLSSDKPPIPYIKNTKKTDASTDILLVTVDLARQVHQDIQTLKAGEIPKKSGVPSHINKLQYLNLLIHLFSHWGVAPKRVFNRSKKTVPVQIGVSLAAAHQFVSDENNADTSGDTDQADQSSVPEPDVQAPELPALKPSRWQVLNISANGMALRNAGDTRADIQVGKLICLKSSQDTNWSIGVVRRAAHNTHQQIEIGTQLISPSAIAAGIREENQEEFKLALLLPEIPALKQPASIIANCNTHAHAKPIDLKVSGKVSRIMLTKLIDRTDDFEQFNFSYL